MVCWEVLTEVLLKTKKMKMIPLSEGSVFKLIFLGTIIKIEIRVSYRLPVISEIRLKYHIHTVTY